MPPSHTTRAASAFADNGSQEDRLAGTIDSSDTKADLLAQLKAARHRIERLTYALGVVADWRDELGLELRRAELRFDLGLVAVEEIDALVGEVAAWRETVDAICEAISAPEADIGAEYPAVALYFRNSREISRSGLSH